MTDVKAGRIVRYAAIGALWFGGLVVVVPIVTFLLWSLVVFLLSVIVPGDPPGWLVAVIGLAMLPLPLAAYIWVTVVEPVRASRSRG